MSNLMVLKDGTPGGLDGTEITNITVKNILDAYSYNEYFVWNASRNITVFPLFLRMKSGYKATSVTITGVKNATYATMTLGSGIYTSYPRYNDAYLGPVSITEQTITSDKNYMIIVAVTISTGQTSIPENSTLLSISYQEDKV